MVPDILVEDDLDALDMRDALLESMEGVEKMVYLV